MPRKGPLETSGGDLQADGLRLRLAQLMSFCAIYRPADLTSDPATHRCFSKRL
jgi:hypothetical protein